MPKQKGGRWLAGRKPVLVQFSAWQVGKRGYVPMEARWGYVTTDELRALQRAVKPMTTPLIPWGTPDLIAKKEQS